MTDSASGEASPEFCAQRAELRGDPMLGTAFPAARVLLVEQPGPWGRRGLAESRFGALGAEVERAANRSGLRVEAIRRPGRVEETGPRRWAIAERETVTSRDPMGDVCVPRNVAGRGDAGALSWPRRPPSRSFSRLHAQQARSVLRGSRATYRGSSRTASSWLSSSAPTLVATASLRTSSSSPRPAFSTAG